LKNTTIKKKSIEPNMFPFSKKIVQKKKKVKPKMERIVSDDPFELIEQDQGPKKKQKKCISFARDSFEEMEENVNIEQYFEGIFCSQQQESEIIESFGLENDLFKDNDGIQ
jgi:hypothetical protein